MMSSSLPTNLLALSFVKIKLTAQLSRLSWSSLLLALVMQMPAAQATDEPSHAAPTATASAEKISGYSQMRQIGYQIGDIATQTIYASTPPGYSLDRGSLPVVGEVGASLQLLSADYQQYSDGRRHVLRLRWQSFRAMQEIRDYALLPLQLKFRRGEHVLQLNLPPSTILVASVLPTMMDSQHALLQPDVKPAPIRTRGLKLQVLAALGLLALVLAYLLWRYDRWPFARQTAPPFRQAWRQLRREHSANKAPNKTWPADVSTQMRVLRRAFDHSLGVALSAERLPLLYQKLPWLLPVQAEIEAFFAQSERVFFGSVEAHPTQIDKGVPQAELTLALSRRLMLLESDAA